MCKEKSLNYPGCFHCRGKLDPKIQPMVQQIHKVSDDEWKKRMDKIDKHPRDQDLAKAREFHEEVMSKIWDGKEI